MQLMVRSARTGKTTESVRFLRENKDCVMLVHHNHERDRIRHEFRLNEDEAKRVISLLDLLTLRTMTMGVKSVVVDNLDLILRLLLGQYAPGLREFYVTATARQVDRFSAPPKPEEERLKREYRCTQIPHPQKLSLWVVYENPKDHPGKFVVRRWENEQPLEATAIADSLEEARAAGVPRGSMRIERHPSDDPVIVESWL